MYQRHFNLSVELQATFLWTKQKRRAEPTAADGVAPVDVDAGDGNVQEEGMAGPSNAPTVPGKGSNVQNFKELAPAAKPEMKYTKRSKEWDEIQLKMLSLLQQENVPTPQQKDDYLDLAFASIAERMRVRMIPDQQEDLLMDINQVVNEGEAKPHKVQQVQWQHPDVIFLTWVWYKVHNSSKLATFQQVPMKCMHQVNWISHSFKTSATWTFN